MNSPGNRIILFYSIDPSGPGDAACGGPEVILSLVEGPHFKECSSSSEFPGGEYGCQSGFSGKF